MPSVFFCIFGSVMESLVQFFIDWGYWGLFLAALAAGSILPFSSEAVMVALLIAGLDPWWCLLAAASGNTIGGMTCYWIGRIGKTEWMHRYLKMDQKKLDRATAFLHGKGALMGFFSFLPYIGEAIAVVLGLMRANQFWTAVSMFVGKAARYAVIIALSDGAMRLF